jgi:hypothetical protein
MELEFGAYLFCGKFTDAFELEEGVTDGFMVGKIGPEKMRHHSLKVEFEFRVRNFVCRRTLP